MKDKLLRTEQALAPTAFEAALSFALMDTGHIGHILVKPFENAGTWLRNMTLFATSSTNTWLQTFTKNRAFIVETSHRFVEQLGVLETCLSQNDGARLAGLLQEAQTFRQTLEPVDKSNNVFRENVHGELKNYFTNLITAPPTHDVFNSVDGHDPFGINRHFELGTLLPYMVAATATLLAKNQQSLKIDWPNKTEASFLNLSAPALENPEFMADFLMRDGSDARHLISEYRVKMKTIAHKIESNDQNFLKKLIQQAFHFRKKMPPQRRFTKKIAGNDPVRTEFLKPLRYCRPPPPQEQPEP